MRPVNQLPPFITQGLYRQYLRPGEIVVILTHRGNAGMVFQAAANFYFRIAGGFVNASLTPQDALPHAITLVAHPSKVADRMFEDYLARPGWAPSSSSRRGKTRGCATSPPSLACTARRWAA